MVQHIYDYDREKVRRQRQSVRKRPVCPWFAPGLRADMKKHSPWCIFALIAIPFFWPSAAAPQSAPKNPFTQPVPVFQLVDQTVVDGIAMLNQSTDIAYAVEFPLGRTIADPAPPLKTVTSSVGSGTLTNALDRLCALDPTFSWQRIGNTVHVFPRSLGTDQGYLFNQKIGVLSFKDVPDAQKAVFDAVAEVAGAKQQIAVFQTGTSINFSHPWTASFNDITVREAFDKIAEQLGPTHGWQFGGAADFRVLSFHERLSVKPNSLPASRSAAAHFAHPSTDCHRRGVRIRLTLFNDRITFTPD
jgi:hypothetical protein